MYKKDLLILAAMMLAANISWAKSKIDYHELIARNTSNSTLYLSLQYAHANGSSVFGERVFPNSQSREKTNDNPKITKVTVRAKLNEKICGLASLDLNNKFSKVEVSADGANECHIQITVVE